MDEQGGWENVVNQQRKLEKHYKDVVAAGPDPAEKCARLLDVLLCAETAQTKEAVLTSLIFMGPQAAGASESLSEIIVTEKVS